jgi:hypothetical protein
MKGEKLSATKTQSDGVAEQRRDIPQSNSLRVERSEDVIVYKSPTNGTSLSSSLTNKKD